MFCPKCGKQVSEGAVFCNFCGKPLNRAQQPPAQQPQAQYRQPPAPQARQQAQSRQPNPQVSYRQPQSSYPQAPARQPKKSHTGLIVTLIVLLLVMLFSGAPFTKALLLFPVFLVLLILFCSGLAMCLSSWIVFFRDIQFLWSVALTAWNFFTPIFYDESILPVGWWTVFFHANPLYQFITAMRKITLDGLAPLPSSLLFCALWAVISMALGLFVFRRHQNQFVLHL